MGRVLENRNFEILRKNEHFRVTMYFNALMGIWPFIFENNKALKRLYSFYSKFTFTYFLMYIVFAYIKLVQIVTAQALNIQEMFANLSITLIYTVALVRVKKLKTKRVENIVREIMITEDKIYNGGDESIIKIYNLHASRSKMSNVIFLINVFFVTALYFIHPIFVKEILEINSTNNETKVIKPLPLSSWFPYDEQKYYIKSYCWQILDGCVGSSFVGYSDIFTFSLIIYPLGQIKILKHILSNFQHYAAKVKIQIKCSKELSSFITLRQCIRLHMVTIRYIEEFNEAMKNIMILDFLQSSIQLASLVIQLFVVEMNIIHFIYYAQFIFSMIIRYLFYYWYANEIMVQSTALAQALYSSNWHDETKEVKYLILMILLRSSKALCLKIGPFNVMSLKTLMKIFKGTYSCMMVMYNAK